MRIAIDAHSVGARLGGNETYATHLIEALAEIDQKNQYTLYVTKLAALDRFANRWPNFTVRRTRPHAPLVRVPLTLSRELRRHPVDVLHVQYTAPPFAPCPIVTTIHDLSFEHLPETFKRRSRLQMRVTIRRTARHAARIIAISEYSRRDIVRTYDIDPEIITVTPIAPPPNLAHVTNEMALKQVRQTYGIEGDYILSLGSIQPRKNLVRLIEAYSLLRRMQPEGKLPQLVLAGKRGWLDRETMRAAEREEAGGGIRFTGYVADEHLSALYSGATCFVYASYFEGFGLPVLEAMKCGAPVVAGNRTSIPEVAGEAALLFDPFDVHSLVEALKLVLNDSQYRAKLSARGLERANEFSWKKTARLTLDVYEKAAATRSESVTPDDSPK
ncbi:MAG TPA: glycosyltransferase family 1 protein [Pyrinomonadaceae bacterium]|jgi:glycosyltransferase involved in cell wall biosynthesis|nr:glycosyltransferase family 1 protein [Pyrinomonadaceae bacterium]